MAMKKAARKRAKKRPKRKSITIVLKQGVDPVEKFPKLSRSRHDRVRFWNKTDRGRTIDFPLWPFIEPPQPILIKAGKKSGWLTIYSGVPANSAYGYSSNPDLGWPGDGPPGSPEVVADA